MSKFIGLTDAESLIDQLDLERNAHSAKKGCILFWEDLDGHRVNMIGDRDGLLHLGSEILRYVIEAGHTRPAPFRVSRKWFAQSSDIKRVTLRIENDREKLFVTTRLSKTQTFLINLPRLLKFWRK